jgi:C4-dicarboxylate-specific signal transduction histidine kinase
VAAESRQLVKWCGVNPEIEDQGRAIAFELKQSLCGIVTNASACLRMLAADPPKFESAREVVRRAIRDSGRALEAVTRLETLFGRDSASTVSVDLNEAAREVLALLSSELEDAGVELSFKVATRSGATDR